jgi:IS30 family transposase
MRKKKNMTNEELDQGKEMTNLGNQIFDMANDMNRIMAGSLDQGKEMTNYRSLTSEQVEDILSVLSGCESKAIQERAKFEEFANSWSYYDGVVQAYHLAIELIERKIR